MSFINTVCVTWQQFIEENQEANKEKRFIYRGHTNEVIGDEFVEWDLKSSFNRYYGDSKYTFETFLLQQYQFIEDRYSNYPVIKESGILNSNLISKIYFFQHYGIPTCFVDFTYNPLIALYFAISSIKGQSGGVFSDDGYPKFYNDDAYVSIIRIDHQALTELLGLKPLIHFNDDLSLNYKEYSIHLSSGLNAAIALDLNPQSSGDFENFNLNRQESCLLLYDNLYTGNLSLEEFIASFLEKEGKVNIEPFIVKYQIKYNSVFKALHSKQPDSISLFKYLKNNKISGEYLFNDLQGLKYDFNFFHQE